MSLGDGAGKIGSPTLTSPWKSIEVIASRAVVVTWTPGHESSPWMTDDRACEDSKIMPSSTCTSAIKQTIPRTWSSSVCMLLASRGSPKLLSLVPGHFCLRLGTRLACFRDGLLIKPVAIGPQRCSNLPRVSLTSASLSRLLFLGSSTTAPIRTLNDSTRSSGNRSVTI